VDAGRGSQDGAGQAAPKAGQNYLGIDTLSAAAAWKARPRALEPHLDFNADAVDDILARLSVLRAKTRPADCGVKPDIE